MSKTNFLQDAIGDKVNSLTEDEAKTLSEKFEQVLESRVDAKVKFQTEVIEAEAKEKYDALLKEATDNFNAKTKELEKGLMAKAKNFKTNLQEAYNKKTVTINENKEQEISTFKENLVEKVDKYLKLELDKKVPDTYVEAVAKVQVLEPIVEGIKGTLNENYLKFDENNLGLLKDAKNEIIKSREENSQLVKENMDLNNKLLGFERSATISKVCEGLTDAQRETATKLLENYDVDEIEDRYNSIADIILEGTKSSDKKTLSESLDAEKTEISDEEETTETGAPTEEVIEGEGNIDAEDEEDVMNTEAPIQESVSPDVAALNDAKDSIQSWAREFKRVSKSK